MQKSMVKLEAFTEPEIREREAGEGFLIVT